MKGKRSLSSTSIRRIWMAARHELGARYQGGVLAIDRRTGRWVAGRDSRQAMLRALKMNPRGQFEFLRIADRPTFIMKGDLRC